MILKTWVTLGLCFTLAAAAQAQTRTLTGGTGGFGSTASPGGG